MWNYLGVFSHARPKITQALSSLSFSSNLVSIKLQHLKRKKDCIKTRLNQSLSLSVCCECMSRQEWVSAKWQTPDHICTSCHGHRLKPLLLGPACISEHTDEPFSTTRYLLSHQSLCFWRKAFHEGGRGILSESCTQLLLWNTHDLKTDIGIVRFLLTGKCSARSCRAPLLVLHFSENSKSYNHSFFYGKCAQVTGRGHFSVNPELLPSQPK